MISHGTNHGNTVYVGGVERQHPVLVFQQDRPFDRRPMRQIPPLLPVELRGFHRRPIKQAKFEFEGQTTPYHLIDFLNVDCAVLDQAGKLTRKRIAGHFHVDPGGCGFIGGAPIAIGQTVHRELTHRIPVADNEPFKPPIVSQDILQKFAISRGRNAINVSERGHESGDARIDRILEGRQIGIAQLIRRNIGRIVIATAF